MKHLLTLLLSLTGLFAIAQDKPAISGTVTHMDAADTVFFKNISTLLNSYSSSNPKENIYLSLDKTAYNPGNTIWFKAYDLVNGNLANRNNLLHVELINNQDSVLTRLNLRADPGITWGDVALPFDYPAGNYRIRAYTQKMADMGNTNYFDRAISVGLENTSNPLATMQPVNALFFPEGGSITNDLRSKIAIKLIDAAGNGVAVSGKITDNTGAEISSFSTGHGGMGLFALTPQSGKRYTAVIQDKAGVNISFELPVAQPAGFSLTVNNQLKDSIYIKIAANTELLKKLSGQKVYLVGQSQGEICYSAVSVLANSAFGARLLKSNLPPGLLQFTLFSAAWKPLNNRIIFNDIADTLKIERSEDRQQQHLLSIAVKGDQDQPVSGSFAVSVTRLPSTAINNMDEGNILPYLQLLTDLKKPVDEPAYYFDQTNNDAKANLDILLLTQENKTFNWNRMITTDTTLVAKRDSSLLALEGFVRATNGNPLPNTKVSVYCITQGFARDTVTDANGHFKFDDVDIEGTADIVVKAKSPTTKNFNIYLKEQSYPEVNKIQHPFIIANAAQIGNDTSRVSILRSLSPVLNNDQANTWKKTTQLKQVNIKEKKVIRYDKGNNYGASSRYTISGDKLREIGPSLLQGLVMQVPGATLKNGVLADLRRGAYPIVLDEHEIPKDEIDTFVSPDDVEDVKILPLSTMGVVYGITARGIGNFLLITTKRFAGTYVNKPVVLKKVSLATDSTGKLLANNGTKILKQVNIKGRKALREDKGNNYGANSRYTISGDKLKELGPSLVQGLVTQVPSVSLANGMLVDLKLGAVSPIPIVLNEHEIPKVELDQLDTFVGPDDVEDVKVLPIATMGVVYGLSPGPKKGKANEAGNFLLITTKRFAGTETIAHISLKKTKTGNDYYFTTPEPSSIINYHFAGYNTPHEFNVVANSATVKDELKTVYWQPNLVTDNDGKAKFKLNDSIPGTYRVAIEGVDTKGKPGRLVYQYTVK